jgi:small-conductance mechanosensitive channel/CRP-like cAMP-binding protein
LSETTETSGAAVALHAAIPSLDEAVVYLAILVLALVVQVPFRRRFTAGRGPAPLALLAGVSYPALVLGLAAMAAQLPGRWSLAGSAESAGRLHAWNLYWLAVLGIAFLDAAVELAYARMGREHPLPLLLRRALVFVLQISALLAVLDLVLDVDITPLLATSAILTMVLGLALQGVLGNLLAGISMNLVRSVEVGNLIGIGEHEGIVVETNWRETILRTRDHDYVHVPNDLLATQAFVNFSKPAKLHRHTLDVGASYTDAPGEVIETLVEAAREAPLTLADPPPTAVLTAFLDFGINYRLHFYSEDYWKRRTIEGEVARLVWYKFKRRGIEIPFPMSDKLLNDFMEVVGHQRRLPVAVEEVERMAGILAASEFLTREGSGGAREPLLGEDAVRELASSCRLVLFTPGEIVCRQGDAGETCWIVARGGISGTVAYEENGKRHESGFTVSPGALFGEMSLLTGMTRTATGRIEKETELLEIPRDAFARVLARDDALAEEIAKIVAGRNEKNREFLEKIASLSAQQVRESRDSGSVLRRLRSLAAFGRRLVGQTRKPAPGS